MAADKKSADPPRIDRWKTLNTFTADRLAALTAATKSPAAGLLWFTLFALANGRDGTVKGASVKRLARLTGLQRNTVRKAVRTLVEMGAITPVGAGRVPLYRFTHLAATPAGGVNG